MSTQLCLVVYKLSTLTFELYTFSAVKRKLTLPFSSVFFSFCGCYFLHAYTQHNRHSLPMTHVTSSMCVYTGNGERCHNGGECIEGKGLEFTCNCAAGWTGVYCDSEIDECESSPCQNGAVCVDKLAHYLCACPTGYTGVNCEEEVMVCDDSPCANSALCLMEEGLPVCYCVPDFHGEKCEYQYDECQIMPTR